MTDDDNRVTVEPRTTPKWWCILVLCKASKVATRGSDALRWDTALKGTALCMGVAIHSTALVIS